MEGSPQDNKDFLIFNFYLGTKNVCDNFHANPPLDIETSERCPKWTEGQKKYILPDLDVAFKYFCCDA